jgi:Zn-dependent peptidase ImmA (M78 family)
MLSYDEISRLKHLYAVSAVALMYRLRDLQIISEHVIRNMFRNPRTSSWVRNEPAPLAEHGDIAELERPRRFESLVYRAVAEGMIRPNRAAEVLRKSIADVEASVWGPQAA